MGLGALFWGACQGEAWLPLSTTADRTTVTLPTTSVPAASGARRLSRVEYDATLTDLLSDGTSSGFALLPADGTDPFDNDYTAQLASGALIDGVEKLATDAAARAVGNPTVRGSLLGCAPSGPGDAACFERFVRGFGRRVLRRSLTDAEVQAYLGLQSFSVEANDFNEGMRWVITALLQQPEFLYRIERGTAEVARPDVLRLSPLEVGTRLSYFLWGSTPPDWLLDAAEQGALASVDDIRAAATRLLSDPRAQARSLRFHALWLGFHRLPHPLALTTGLQAESEALLRRVLFDEKGDYLSLFRATETFADATLASHYGLTTPGSSAGWMSYAGTKRQGLLSQGAVLSAGAKFDDTSPTQRGIFIRTRLMCQEIPPPPPNANVDQPPTSPTSNCKVDRYASHASVGTCAGCHQNLDPIGFGLENYDRAGKYRTVEEADPTCTIRGQGFIKELGEFSGPAELSNLLVQSGQLERCAVTQLYRFSLGRRERAEEVGNVQRLSAKFSEQGRSFVPLLLNLVGDETFAFRREEEPTP
jgi:hypothetical protein